MSRGHVHDEALPPGVPEVTLAPREPRLRRPPFGIIAVFLVLVIATWVPLVFFARARVSPSGETRVQIFQDMGEQPRFDAQRSTELFLDHRVMRPKVAGTVARGEAELDDHFFRGYALATGGDGKQAATFFDDFPQSVQVDRELLARGRERYNIYCAICHGIDGYGRGPVAIRADELGNALNVASLHSDEVRARSEGHLFNTITVGIRNMPGYGGQIRDPKDRWAIVAYVRALQLSQHAPADIAQAPAGNP